MLAEEALVDALGGQRRRERHVAAGQALAEAEEVGSDALLLAREHRPRSPEARRDLVADQQRAVAVAGLAHRAQIAGRLDAHPRRALDERLDDHGGDLLAVAVEGPLELGGVAGRHVVGAEEERLVGGVEEVDAADRGRAERVAVVGVAQADERGAARVLAAALVPVLERHLERDLDRGRARVGVEDARRVPAGRSRPGARPARRRPGVSARASSNGRRARAARAPPGR